MVDGTIVLLIFFRSALYFLTLGTIIYWVHNELVRMDGDYGFIRFVHSLGIQMAIQTVLTKHVGCKTLLGLVDPRDDWFPPVVN